MTRTSFSKIALTAIFLFGSIYTGITLAEGPTDTAVIESHMIFLPKDIQWQDGPESLPKGAKVAVLEGDPAKEGLFTMRLKFPADYRIPPHWHPMLENVTVITGTLYLGMGDTFDTETATPLPVGSFAYMQPRIHHFAFTHKETIVQLHAIGPWSIAYVNPQDDPRNKKEPTS